MSTIKFPGKTGKLLTFGQRSEMSWVDRLEPQISAGPLQKGRSYFQSGRVAIQSGSAANVEATVRGSILYHVEIQVVGKDILATCTCPYFDSGDVCKHVWATLLAAEAGGFLGDIARLKHPFIDIDFIGDLDEDGDLPRLAQPKSVPPPPPKPAPWKQQLSALRSSVVSSRPPASEPERKVLYVVDGPSCAYLNGLIIRAVVCRRKKNGEWGRPNFQETYIRELDRLEPADQRLLALLTGGRDAYAYHTEIQTKLKLPPASHDVLLPMLCGSGQCFLQRDVNPDDLVPLEWDGGPAWNFEVHVARNDEERCYEVTASLRRDAERLALNDASLLIPGLVFQSNRVSRLPANGDHAWIAFLRKTPMMKIPFDSRTEFFSELAKFPDLPPIEMPPELLIDRRSPDRPPQLKVRKFDAGWSRPSSLICEVAFHYGPVLVPEREASCVIFDPASDRLFSRDPEGERASIERLQSVGVRRAAEWQQHRWELPLSKLPKLTQILIAEGWRVEAEGKLYRKPTNIRMRVHSGIDWFELEAQATFEDQAAAMPDILKAIARGRDSVVLGDGSFGVLPEEWIKRYRLVAGFGQSTGGHLRFATHQAGLLDALLAAEPDVNFDAAFLRVREELKSFRGIQPAPEPATFNGRLRDYQRDGLGWLHFIRRFGFGGCLADDMGLGKTVQVLALLDGDTPQGPALIVAPRSLIFNWKQETSRFAPRLRILDQTGLNRRDRWKDVRAYDVVLATYGTLRRDILVLKDIEFDTIILDEAQAIKNAASESAKAVRLLKSKHRLVLTGTPIENRLNDLWSLFEFLNPGMLGTAPVFRSHAIAKPNGSASPVSDEPLQIVSKALRPFILRRTKEQVARELPAKTEQTIYCEMAADQRRVYEKLRDHYRASLLGRVEEMGIQKTRMHILEALLRLRQAACHPGLIDKTHAGEPSAKIDALLPQLAEVLEEGHKALVFSQFTSLLSILRQKLDEQGTVYEYLDGRTRDRDVRVRRFEEDAECPLFLISLKAGGLGLNLTAAEYVFLLDPWWNPAVEAQAIDRTHRIGQKNQVFAYRLIARNTVEEKVLELQKTKRDLAEAIITADNSLIAGLTREHLDLLLS